MYRRVAHLILVVVAYLVGGCFQPSDAPRRVIWICIDSLRPDHLGYGGYGRDTSPWLDALSDDSANFTMAIAPGDATTVSVAAYMSGQLFSRLHGTSFAGRFIPGRIETLPEVFKRAGFTTYFWTANPNAGERQGHTQGVDSYRMFSTPNGSNTIDGFIRLAQDEYRPSGSREFIYLHLMDVHYPYAPHVRFRQHYVSGEYTRNRVAEGVIRHEHGGLHYSQLPYYRYKEHLFEGEEVDPSDLEQLVAIYDSGIRYVDNKLEELLTAFHYDPDEDVLIVMADHGEQFYEHSFWGHGFSTLMEEIHVPLLVRYPNVDVGVYEAPVSLLDLYPTLCELFELTPPEGLSGRSLLSYMRGEEEPQRVVVSEGAPFSGARGVLLAFPYLYKLDPMAYLQRHDAVWPFREQLFNIRSDPGCMDDLASRNRDLAGKLNAALRSADAQYAPYTPEVIREKPVVHGDNLFHQGDQIFLIADHASEGRKKIIASTTLLIEGVIGPVSLLHHLQFEYLLEESSLTLELAWVGEEKPLWTTTLNRTADQWVQVESVILLEAAGRVEFTGRLSGSGRAQIRNLKLRRYGYPHIPLAPWGGGPRPKEHPDELTGAERDLLNTLGYLQ